MYTLWKKVLFVFKKIKKFCIYLNLWYYKVCEKYKTSTPSLVYSSLYFPMCRCFMESLILYRNYKYICASFDLFYVEDRVQTDLKYLQSGTQTVCVCTLTQ